MNGWVIKITFPEGGYVYACLDISSSTSFGTTPDLEDALIIPGRESAEKLLGVLNPTSPAEIVEVRRTVVIEEV
jgi:hypothetical protein